MINVFVLQNGRLNQVNIDSRDDLEQAAPVWVDLTDPNDDERAWVKTHLRRDPAGRGRSQGHRGVGPLLRSRKRRPAPAHRLPAGRRRRPVARGDGGLHPGPQHAVLGAYRRPAGVPPGAHARALAARLDRRLHGRAARPVCDRCRVFGRCARRHLPEPGRSQPQRAAEGIHRPGRGRSAECDRARGRLERPHPPQHDGYPARGQLPDARTAAQCRPVRGSAPDPARHRVARRPHRPSCSTRSTS